MSLRDRRAFTLIELILTIVILAIGLFGVMIVFDNTTRAAMEADLKVTAVELGRERLEGIIADKVFRGYSYISLANYPAAESLTGTYDRYQRRLNIFEVSPQDLSTPVSGSGYKRIEVTVRWGERVTQQVGLSTVVAEY